MFSRLTPVLGIAPIFLLHGEIIRVFPHDDGYILSTEKICYRFTMSVFDPASWPTFDGTAGLDTPPVVPFELKRTVAWQTREDTFVRGDQLTDEQQGTLEAGIEHGAIVTWKVVLPPVEPPVSNQPANLQPGPFDLAALAKKHIERDMERYMSAPIFRPFNGITRNAPYAA